LQYIKSTDTQTAGEMPESSCMVRIVAATYSEDGEEGALCVLNLLTRIRIAFLRDGVIAERFMLKPPIEIFDVLQKNIRNPLRFCVLCRKSHFVNLRGPLFRFSALPVHPDGKQDVFCVFFDKRFQSVQQF